MTVGWMELIGDHRVFLVRSNPDLWEQIQHGMLKSWELLRPSRTERLPEFRFGDVLLLYHPERPDGTPPELSTVVRVRSALSNEAGVSLGPLFRITPPIGRERLLFASQRGTLPEIFQRADDRTFILGLLRSEQRDHFLQYVLNAGITLEIEQEKGGPPVEPPVGETPVIVEFEWEIQGGGTREEEPAPAGPMALPSDPAPADLVN